MAPNNALPVWGNEKTMNLNNLILTNIQSSPYFKVNLFELKTYHEVIDEIYYKVNHLEPWEKGSRKTAGQTGMCGGVRGVGAGGIVSSAYCLLYKLFTLKLTKKQLIGLITHADSPYIRGLGFMYIRYTQPPSDLWEWYEEYLDDEEEVDVKAGGGHVMTMGEMCRQFLVKLEWYSTLFPRIPVPVQKMIQEKLKGHPPARPIVQPEEVQSVPPEPRARGSRQDEVSFGEAERMANRRSPPRKRRSRSPRRSPKRASSPKRSPRRSPPRKHSPKRSPPKHDWEKERERDRERGRDRERERGGSMNDFARELERERQRQRREKERNRSRSRERKRSRSRDRKEKSHSHGDKADRHKHRSEEHRERRRSRSKEKKSSKSRKRSRSHERKRSRSKERSYDKSGHKSRHERDSHHDTSLRNRYDDNENGES